MRPIEDLRLDQRLRERLGQPFSRRINVFAKVRMVNEAFAADFQLLSKLAQVGFHHVPVRMDKGIETENEIYRRVGNHRQGATIIQVAADMRMTRKTLLARFDTLIRFINSQQLVAVILQIMRPSSEPRPDFQNRVRGQALANPRKNCASPLRGRAAPRLRPFLARLSPIVLHLIEWLGAESNRRHVDFQSTALPTELPSLLPMKFGFYLKAINSLVGSILAFSASKTIFDAIKRPTLRVLEYPHSKTHPFYLDLRPFNKGRRFFKTKAEAERLRQITTLERHGREAVGLSPAELSAIIQARKELAKHGKTIEDATAFYLDHLERIRRCNVNVADLAKEVVEAKRKDGMSTTYIADLKKRLARFSADFGERKIAAITVEELDNWLRALPGSPKSRANYRANVGVLNPPEIFTVDELRSLLMFVTTRKLFS